MEGLTLEGKARLWVATAFLIFGLAGSAVGQERPGGSGSSVSGVEKGPTPVYLTSPGIRAELHSSVHLDYYGFDRGEQYVKDVGSQENTFGLRRARLTLRGRLWDSYGFYLQAAFEIPEDPFIDAVITIPVAPGVDFYAGKMKMPFSDERLKSFATHQPFMERSLVSNLELRRSQGVMFSAQPGSGAIAAFFGCFTGENMNKPNTDDDFEYVGRLLFRADPKIFADLPFQAAFGFSAAYGRRSPIRDKTYSFIGKTQNELVFFSKVPVNGYRKRYEADIDFRYRSLWLGGEWILSEEERHDVKIDLDTNGDGEKEEKESVTRDLDPLREEGWMAYLVWYITGEDAGPNLQPGHKWGALGIAVRYAAVSYEAGDERVQAKTPGVWGREVSASSQSLNRPSINETVRDLYVGFDWILNQGVFIQFAVVWQWFDDSSPYSDDPGRHADINYRARVGMMF